MTEKTGEIVIKKEDAVFWLDKEGFWRNDGGKFRNKKIIDYFHRAIAHDDRGWYVRQERDGLLEKVYFPHEDTALFVFDVIPGDRILLILNTGAELPLDPDRLFIRRDNLYMQTIDGPARFIVRAMMKLSDRIEEGDNGRMMIRVGEGFREIPERDNL